MNQRCLKTVLKNNTLGTKLRIARLFTLRRLRFLGLEKPQSPDHINVVQALCDFFFARFWALVRIIFYAFMFAYQAPKTS